MAESDVSSVLSVSQPTLCRSSQATIKRVLSVDDLNDIDVSQFADNSIADKSNGGYVVVNSSRRRKLKQRSTQMSSQQKQLSPSRVGAVHSHWDVSTQNSTKDDTIQQCDNISTHKVSNYCTMLGVSVEQQDIVMSKESFVYVINELESLKIAVSTFQKQFNFVTSFLGIAENSLSLSNDDFLPYKREVALIRPVLVVVIESLMLMKQLEKAHNHNKLGLHRHMLVLPAILLH